jgi:hypothetical protein
MIGDSCNVLRCVLIVMWRHRVPFYLYENPKPFPSFAFGKRGNTLHAVALILTATPREISERARDCQAAQQAEERCRNVVDANDLQKRPDDTRGYKEQHCENRPPCNEVHVIIPANDVH